MRGAPQRRVGLGHPADERSDLRGDRRAAGPALPALPGPEELEASPMPPDHRLGLDDGEEGRGEHDALRRRVAARQQNGERHGRDEVVVRVVSGAEELRQPPPGRVRREHERWLAAPEHLLDMNQPRVERPLVEHRPDRRRLPIEHRKQRRSVAQAKECQQPPPRPPRQDADERESTEHSEVHQQLLRATRCAVRCAERQWDARNDHVAGDDRVQ